jgi:hypothetical protein
VLRRPTVDQSRGAGSFLAVRGVGAGLCRPLRFSLRTVLVFVLLAGGCLGWLSLKDRGEREAAQAITRAGGFVRFGEQRFETPRPVAPPTSWRARLLAGLRARLFRHAVAARTGPGAPADIQLVHIRRFARLEALVCQGAGLTDAGLRNLSDLWEVKDLDFESPNVTDAGLIHLAGLRELESLTITAAPVTDTGLIRLQGLRKLRTLTLWHTRVTKSGVDRLKRALPGLAVRADFQTQTGNAPAYVPAEIDSNPLGMPEKGYWPGRQFSHNY